MTVGVEVVGEGRLDVGRPLDGLRYEWVTTVDRIGQFHATGVRQDRQSRKTTEIRRDK